MKRLGVVVLAAMMAGCGTSYPAMLPGRSTMMPQRINALSTRSAQDVVAKANEVYGSLKDCTAEITTWAVETPGDKDPVYGEAKFTFKKARKERIEITKANDDAKKVGSIIVYTGGDKAQILLKKAIPILGRLFTLKLTDKRLATSRGVRLDQMDLQAMIDRLNAKRTTIKPDVREETLNGRKVLVLTLTGSFKGVDDEVTSEEVAFDAETGVPALDTAFVGKEPVLRLGVNNLKPNVGVADNQFVLSDDRLAVR
jgi:outer membrane lipoprotein-sorting protein